MARRAFSGWGRRCLSTAVLLRVARTAHGAASDEKGYISLGLRAHTAARIGTEDTDVTICNSIGGKTVCGGSNGAGPTPDKDQVLRSLTFRVSAAGHLRQSRFFVEVVSPCHR